MSRISVIFLTIVIFAFGLVAGDFKINGVYTAWAQSQHAFMFDKDKYDHNYVVQMLRFKLQGIANDNLKLVTRLDLAQGWWGVDNALRTVNRSGATGASSLFDFKDTNYLIHIDQAYIDFTIPKTPISMRVGRMWYGLGNKIMVDNNYEGVQVDLNEVVGKKVSFGWAKVSEGADNLSDDETVGADVRGNFDARDAHLFTLNFQNQTGDFSYDAFGFYYNDASIGDTNAFVPDHLQFFKTRFSPQVTELISVGLAGTYKAGQITVNGEVDYLTGKDDINVNDEYGLGHNGQMWDINDGDLSGYNAYLKLNYAATDKLSVGAVGGIGSGDDDLTKGKGNVNKLRTSGFFYITEVWEDSIMPDEEGITPQGLGAPNVRGYRELENTTIFQVNGTLKPVDKFTAFASYSFIRATEPIHAWSIATTESVQNIEFNPDVSASDIGQEIDFRFSYAIFNELNFTLRGGYFIPGDAAGYLIRGTNEYDDPAWELKSTITYKF